MNAHDFRYDPSLVAPEFRAFFAALHAALGADYEIWVRVEDFGRKIEAAVVNRSTKIAVRLRVQQGLQTIRSVLAPADITTIRRHLTSNATEDLVL
jgi:hypothetical protein